LHSTYINGRLLCRIDDVYSVYNSHHSSGECAQELVTYLQQQRRAFHLLCSAQQPAVRVIEQLSSALPRDFNDVSVDANDQHI
jgi:hypothetical protein